MNRCGAIGLVAVVGLTTSVSIAQPEPYTKGTVLIVDTASMDRMLPDAKDQGLVRALAMLPGRVKELPGELPDLPPEAAGIFNTVMTCIGKPFRLMVAYDGDLPTGGLFGYGIGISFLIGDEAAAGEVHTTVSGLMAQSGQRIKKTGTRWKGMSDIQTPVGLVSFGPRNAKDGWRYEVVFGTMNDADGAAAAALPKADGFEPLIRARMDFAGLTPLKDMANQLGAGGPMVEEMLSGVKEMGLIGEQAVKISYIAGITKDESVSLSTWEGVKPFAGTLHLSQTPLTPADYAVVPADATDVYMAKIGEDGFGYLLASVLQLGDEGQEVLSQIKQHTGVDLQKDLLDAMGGTAAVYMSETTGGGGLTSMVAMMKFRDRAKAVGAMNKFAAAANQAVEESDLPAAYINVASWKDGETDLMTLRFPGVPVPLELTMAMTKEWLVFSPIPQGAVAAARQASGKGDGGLMANASFRSRLPEGKPLVSMSFSDTPRTMKDGYGLLSMAGSAVSNLVRSPHGATRDPGLVVPLYKELATGARSRVTFTYWRGEDLVTETRADRSGLVSAAGSLAMMLKIAPALVIPAAAVSFAAEESQLIGVGPREASGSALARAALRAMPMGTLSVEQSLLLMSPRFVEVAEPMWRLPQSKETP